MVKLLQEKNKIKRVGSKKRGEWIVIKDTLNAPVNAPVNATFKNTGDWIIINDTLN